jgi:hypothetical protein
MSRSVKWSRGLTRTWAGSVLSVLRASGKVFQGLYSFWPIPETFIKLIHQAPLVYPSYPQESLYQIWVRFHFIFLAVVIDQSNQPGLSLGQEL